MKVDRQVLRSPSDVVEIREKLNKRLNGSLLEDIFVGYNQYDLANKAAALSLYGLMSLFPIVAILVWATTMAGTPDEIGLWVSRFSIFLPPDFAGLLVGEIQYRMSIPNEKNVLLVIFHFSLLLFSAGSCLRSLLFCFRQMGGADDRIGIVGIVLRSFLFMFPVLLSVFLSSLIMGLGSYVAIMLTSSLNIPWMLSPILWSMVTILVAVFLNGIYASSLIGHQVVQLHGWFGSGLAAIGVTIVTIGMTKYFSMNPSTRELSGSPGFIINVLLWFFACSNCVLIGALINVTRRKRQKRAQANASARRERLEEDTSPLPETEPEHQT